MPNTSKKSKHLLFLLLLIVFGFAIIPFIALAFFSHPSVDDYLMTAMALESDFLVFYSDVFREVNTRYFGALLYYINPLMIRWFLGHQLVAIVWILLMIISLYSIAKGLITNSRKQSLLASLFFTVTYLSLMPWPSESLYWMSGAFYHLFPLFLFLFWFRTAISISYGKFKIVQVVLLFIISIIIGGLNESLSILMGIVSLGIVVFIREAKGKAIFILQSSLLLFIFGFLFWGGFVDERISKITNELNLWQQIAETIGVTLKISVLVFQSIVFFLSSILFFITYPLFKHKLGLLYNRIRIKPIWTLLLSVATIMILYFPAVYIIGIVAWRIHNNIAFILMLAWYFNLGYFLHYYKIRSDWGKYPKTIYLILVLYSFFLFSDLIVNLQNNKIEMRSNVSQAYYDLFVEAPTYHAEMKSRYVLIDEYKHNDNTAIEVPALTYRPQLIYFADIDTNPEFWVNEAVARYFEIESIKSEPITNK